MDRTIELETARMLHDEHVRILALLRRLEGYSRREDAGAPPDAASDGGLLGDVVAAIEGEMTLHFDFEEAVIFPLLAEEGEEPLGALLREEHAAIRAVAAALVQAAKTARRGGFSPASWNGFQHLARDFIGALGAHAEKEEFGLIPLLDTMIAPEDDAAMAEHYAGMH